MLKKNDSINDVDDLARLFVKTLKEISARGDSLTVNALISSLSSCQELNNLINQAKERRETLAQPVLEEEIRQLRLRLEEKEQERSRTANRLFDAENDLDREKDYYKRLVMLMLSLAGSRENSPMIPLLEEIKEMFINNATLAEREKVLPRIRNQIMKMELSQGGRDSGERSTLIGGLLKRVKADPLSQIKKAACQSLIDLQAVIGSEYAPDLTRLKERIEASEDFDYLISLRQSLIDIIERYKEKGESDKERVTGFVLEVGERLSALETNLAQSNATTKARLRDDLEFHENLASDIGRVRDSMQKSDRFEELKNTVLSRLENISSSLFKKKEEYVIRIKSSDEDNDKIQGHFKQVIASLKDKNKILQEQSSRDPLTGLYNRRVCKERLDIEFERFKRYHTSFSILFLDIDHFKNVNDTFGHDAGDRALKGIAQCTGDVLRKVDILSRYGGEEFVVILFETDIVRAVTVAEKLRGLIEATQFEYKGKVVPITVSIGVSTVRETDTDPDQVINRADALLYRAKNTGRNKVISDLDQQ